MFCIAVYDINEKRVSKVLKLFRQYLHWVQNSVFEGHLSPKQIDDLIDKALEIIDPEEDSIIIYIMETDKYVEKLNFGIDKSRLTSNFIE